jgi:hypothetical protein
MNSAWPVTTAIALVFVLTGCTSAAPAASPTSAASPPVAESSPSPTTVEEPVIALVPDGTAVDNLPFFSSVVADVWASPEKAAGRAYIDALTVAGFDRAAMQVTYDESTVGNAAESIQFSVRWGEECLVGQVGPATGEPVTVVLPALAEGTCLVGDTRPIDW